MIESCPYQNKCNKRDCDKDFCKRKYRLDCLFDNSLLPIHLRKHKKLFCDEDGTDLAEFTKLANIEQNIENFVSSGTNLFIHSAFPGNGKSSWSIRLLIAYFYKIWMKSNFKCQGLFISVPSYLLALKDSITKYNEYANFINSNVLEADIVVWDDIGAKIGTEFELNHLLNIINTRMNNGKCNIFTSNLSKKEMVVALGERLASRVCNKSIDIEFHGSDKRYLDLIHTTNEEEK